MRRLLPLLLVSVLAAPASALDLPSIVCTCADDARNRGDWVACMSLLTQRLVAAGDMSPQAIPGRAAGGPQRTARRADCGGEPGPPQWGVAVQADRQVLQSGAPATFEALLWSFTPDHVTGLGGSGGGGIAEGRQCLFEVRLLAQDGAVVHVASNPCPAAITEYPLAPGQVRRFSYEVPLVSFNSETGDPDGAPLPAGTCRAVIATTAPHPERIATFDGLVATAELPLVVEE